jgi:hypothetical protein
MKREWEIMNMKKGQGIKEGTHKVSPHKSHILPPFLHFKLLSKSPPHFLVHQQNHINRLILKDESPKYLHPPIIKEW